MITTNGTAPVRGGIDGIRVNNYSSDAIITTNAAVTGGSGRGINVVNKFQFSNTVFGESRLPNNIIITSAANTLVSGGAGGIQSRNYGIGFTEITVNGDALGENGEGIRAVNAADVLNRGHTDFYTGDYTPPLWIAPTNLTVTAAPGSQVRGLTGIRALNYGTGSTSITVSGEVAGGNGAGIDVLNRTQVEPALTRPTYYGPAYDAPIVTTTPTDITITTAAGSSVSGANGINATNNGTGATSITVSGAVSGAAGDGIHVFNGKAIFPSSTDYYGNYHPPVPLTTVPTEMTITTTAGSLVTGAQSGIVADQAGTGALTVVASGKVTGTTAHGIATFTSGPSTTTAIEVASGGLVQGATDGIAANSWTGQVTISNDGTVQNLSGQSFDLAIVSVGAPASITNTHLVTGTVSLGDGGNSFDNAAIWNTAGGSNEFGADVAANSINNRDGATIIAAASGASAPVTTTFNGLGTFTNAGLILMQNGVVGDRTVVTGNYIGAKGAISFDTFLGDDASPSDRLVLDGGTAAGSSLVRVVNVGGRGALTTGNGILVVDAIHSAVTAQRAFALAGPVAVGPYEYDLFRSSLDASNPDAWYLRSTIDCSVSGAPTPPCPTPVPVGPPSPPEPPPPDVLIPHYRAEVSLYVALPSLAQLYGRALLDTLHERVGEEEDLRDRPSARSEFNGLWGRLIQWNGVRDGTNGGIYGSQGPQFNYDLFAFQVGTDVYAHQSTDGSRDHLGLVGSGGRIEATVTDVVTGQAAGNDKINATSAGGYWTHYDRHAAYLDAVFQYTWYDATAASLRFPALEGNATGIAASLEAGKPFHFSDSKAWVLEPQLQGIYQHFDRDQTGDVAGLVTFNDTESFLGRVGLRLADRFADTGPGGHDYRLTLWGRVNLWHEFMDSPETLFATQAGAIPFTANPGKTWVETNAGATAQVSQRTTIFASLGYQWDTEGDGHAYNGKIGVRMNW